MMVAACSVTKSVPDGSLLLSDVKIISHVDNKNASNARLYIKQTPNAKWFGIARVPLRIYSSAGSDTAKWVNKALHKIGEAPVIYSPALAEQSKNNIVQMLQNDGYLHATVDYEHIETKKKQTEVVYYLHESERYFVKSITLETDDDSIAAFV